jgi:NAD(P)-dependent dehydrogenase (short-subunit alcohol dehydrogenase family)
VTPAVVAETQFEEMDMDIRNARGTGLALAAAGLATAIAVRAKRSRRRFDFRGKSVVITGGSRGLGLVLARQLAAEGARITLIARDEDELRRAADDIRNRHPSAEVLIVPADVGEREQVERATSRTIGHYGSIDVLINNAGIIQVGPLDHMKVSDYDDAFKTHFWGPLFLVLAMIPHMRRQGGGRIVNISSIGGRISVPHLVPYSASKFALTGLSDGLRAELARDQIVVTTVCPGLMRIGSPINAAFKGKRAQEYSWFAIASSLPLLTISAERAAAQILRACRRGDAELVITVQAKLALLARTIAPELFSDAMSLVHRLLPRAVGREGDVAAPGRSAGSDWASSTVLAPMYAAAERNNEL